jgi:hypothetical protein
MGTTRATRERERVMRLRPQLVEQVELHLNSKAFSESCAQRLETLAISVVLGVLEEDRTAAGDFEDEARVSVQFN